MSKNIPMSSLKSVLWYQWAIPNSNEAKKTTGKNPNRVNLYTIPKRNALYIISSKNAADIVLMMIVSTDILLVKSNFITYAISIGKVDRKAKANPVDKFLDKPSFTNTFL